MTFTGKELASELRACRGYAIRLAGQDGEDLLQEVAVKALHYRHKFVGGSLRAWLLTIIRNQWFSHARANSRRLEACQLDEWAEINAEATGTVEDAYIAREGIGFLRKLTPDHRTALMTRVSSESDLEAAASLGIPLGTIKTRVHRGRARLSALIETGGRA